MAPNREGPHASERAIGRAPQRRAPLNGIEKVAAKFAHLGEERRQREAEERARAQVADLYDNLGTTG